MAETQDRARRLEHKTALVTGAAQGLGLGIAEQLARDGAAVIIADINVEKAKVSAADLCRRELSVRAEYLDVADSGAVNAIFERLSADHGTLDILVNNAGVGQTVAPVVQLTDQEWERVLRITLT